MIVQREKKVVVQDTKVVRKYWNVTEKKGISKGLQKHVNNI